METTEIVAKLTAPSLQNSYLMTYMGSIRETLAQSGFRLTPEVAALLGDLNNPDTATSDLTASPHYEQAVLIHQKIQTPDFQESLKQTYKAKMFEVLEQLEIELTPEAIAAFQVEVSHQPEHFAGLFASVL